MKMFYKIIINSVTINNLIAQRQVLGRAWFAFFGMQRETL
jgi:hypothetical protein